MIGDFNYRLIDWDKMTSCDREKSHFINCIEDHYLTQHVKEATRCRGNDTPSVLDLVITNEEEMVDEIDIQSPIGKSDHAVIVLNMRCYIERNASRKITRKKYHLANYDNMKNDLLKVNWKEVLKDQNAEETADMLLEHLYNTEKRNVPTVTKNGNHMKSVPVDKELSQLIKKKTQMSRKVMNSKRRGASTSEVTEMKKDYNRARNQVRKNLE